MTLPILCIDFETTDLPESGGVPMEFAAQLLDGSTLLPVDGKNSIFHTFFKLERSEHIAEEAFKLHGITREFVDEHGVDRLEAGRNFGRWLVSHGFHIPTNLNPTIDSRQLQVLGQNVHFDIHFLRTWMTDKFMEIFHYRYLDCMPIADFVNRAHEWAFGWEGQPFINPQYGTPSVALVAQARTFDMDYSMAHGALFDTLLTARVFRQHIVEMSQDLRLARQAQTEEDRDRLKRITGSDQGAV